MAGSSSGSFRELEDKPCSAEICHAKWSPKMDLLAIITNEGDVWLNRLSWQQVWSVSASNGKAVDLAWRPDGKLLCVGYEGGEIRSFDIENAECVHTFNIGATATCMDWTEEQKPKERDVQSQPFNVEKSELYLPPLPYLPKSGGALFSSESSDEGNKDPKKLLSLPDELNVLTIGDDKGRVHVIIYGIFVSGVLAVEDERKSVNSSIKKITSASFSSNLDFLTVVANSENSDNEKKSFTVFLYNTKLLASYRHELSLVAKKVGSITTLMEYFNETIRSMSEAWEDILLEMDTKLTTFATERLSAGSSVCNEFLTLLTQGTSTPELQAFLLHELTEKGLKKLGHSIENSYSSIQNLALRHLQCVNQALLFHLTEVSGMSKWYNLFGVLGLSEKSTQAAIKSLGSVMLKTTELVEVIETSLKSFKAFFQWLYSVILRLSDEPVPSYVKQFSQQDIMLLANFLQNQLATDENGKFSLERVGQYFEDKPLSVPSSYGDSPWTRFVASSATLRESPLIISHKSEQSLVTLSNTLLKDVNAAFQHVSEVVVESFSCKGSILLGDTCGDIPFAFTQVSHGSPATQYLAFCMGEDLPKNLHVMKLDAKAVNESSAGQIACVRVSELGQNTETEQEEINLSICDAMFYNSETITVLLKDVKSENEAESVLIQVPLSLIDSSWFRNFKLSDLQDGAITEIPELEGHEIGEAITQCRRLTGMLSDHITVSGSRKVSCVLSISRRRAKIFDMDAEDEEEEEEAETSKDITDDSVMED